MTRQEDLKAAVLEWVHLMGPLDHQQLAQDLAFLREKANRGDIPAHNIDDLLAAIGELREAGRVVRVNEGLKWCPAKEAVGQGKLF